VAAANPPAGAMPGALAPALPRTGWLGLEYKWLVLIAMLPGFTVFLLDVTIVNVAPRASARSSTSTTPPSSG